MFIKSNDNLNIYYNVEGTGPAILLLHGFGDDHTSWIKAGWVAKLKQNFTVIVTDIRGCGKSDKPISPDAYTLDNHCADIDKVLETVNTNKPIIWGWSLGATIAMHYAKRTNVKAMIACGSYFGLIFSDEFVKNTLAEMKDEINIARTKAFHKWPLVYPNELTNPFLMYTGTNDGNVVIQLKKQQKDIENVKGKLIIFEDVNHFGLINEISKVKIKVMDFIQENK